MTLTHVAEPQHRLRLLDRNFSSRLGARPTAIAIHSTEGADIPNSVQDLDGLRNWFNNPAAQASAHLGIDGDGHAYRMVADEFKAWTILQLNPVTLNIEMVGFASQAPNAWEGRQVNKVAQYVAYWSHKYGIPIRHGLVRSVNGFPVVLRSGVITHKQLTDAGFGTHTDPGKNFPFMNTPNSLMRKAKHYHSDGWKAD
jgi:N-acetyl-anhydromuramyl-L-alanine amidase AmpD